MLRWCFLCLNVVVSYFWWSGPIRCKCGWDQHQEHQQQLHGEPTALTQTVGWCIIDPLNIHFSYFFQLQSANKLAPVSAADVQPVFVVFSSICGLFVLSYANLEMFFFQSGCLWNINLPYEKCNIWLQRLCSEWLVTWQNNQQHNSFNSFLSVGPELIINH